MCTLILILIPSILILILSAPWSWSWFQFPEFDPMWIPSLIRWAPWSLSWFAASQSWSNVDFLNFLQMLPHVYHPRVRQMAGHWLSLIISQSSQITTILFLSWIPYHSISPHKSLCLLDGWWLVITSSVSQSYFSSLICYMLVSGKGMKSHSPTTC